MEYLLFTDETNKCPGQDAKFFIYGGVFFPTNRLKEVHSLVEESRLNNNYRSEDKLKFETNSRPNHVTPSQHRAAKQAILDGCLRLDVKFVACLVLHDIASRHIDDILIKWGANSVIFAFESFLEEENATGTCIADRIPFKASFQYLQEKFQVGLTFPWGQPKKLERIHLFGFSCIGASHACSVSDIVLGAFRYCVNKRENNQIARNLLPKIIRMMWHKRENNRVKIKDYGLLFRPKVVRVEQFRNQYDELARHLVSILNEAT